MSRGGRCQGAAGLEEAYGYDTFDRLAPIAAAIFTMATTLRVIQPSSVRTDMYTGSKPRQDPLSAGNRWQSHPLWFSGRAMKIFSSNNLFLLSQASWAGGDIVLVRKISFDDGKSLGSYTVTLIASRSGEMLQGCKQFSIRGGYNFWRWWVRNPSPTAPTWRGHQAAVRVIGKTEEAFLFGFYRTRSSINQSSMRF